MFKFSTKKVRTNQTQLRNQMTFTCPCHEIYRDEAFGLFQGIFLRNRSLSNARWFYGKKT